MIKSVQIKFDKLLHETGKAILVRIDGAEHWIPIKLCRKLVVNSKLGGNVCLPTFFVEKMGLNVNEYAADIEVLHHVPEPQTKPIIYDADLFR